MDEELRALLAIFDDSEDEGIDIESAEAAFQTKAPGWHIALFTNQTLMDDDTVLHIWNDTKNYWVHIHTNDDPLYTPMVLYTLFSRYSSDLPN